MKRKFLRKLYKAILLLAAGLWIGLGAKGWAFPGAGQLPGNGTIATGSATYSNSTPPTGFINAATLSISGNTAILWGSSGGTLNVTGSGPGFNVGSAAQLFVSGSGALLNVDTTGSPSYIMGTISASGIPVYVANGSGIIVGSGASITAGGVGLLGYDLSSQASAFSGTVSVTPSMTTGGAVTIQSGASKITVGTGNTILVAAPSVNVGVATPTSFSGMTFLDILSGYSVTGYNVASGSVSGGPSPIPGTSGSITLSGPTSGFFTNPASSFLYSSGSITTNGNLVLSGVSAQWGTGNPSNLAASNFTNNGTITGDFSSSALLSGSLVNNGSIIASASNISITVGGSITNNSGATIGSTGFNVSLDAAGGGINNMGTITANTSVTLTASNPNHLGPYPAGSISNTGTISITSSSSSNTLDVVSSTGSIFLGGTVSLANGTDPSSTAHFRTATTGTVFMNTPLTVYTTNFDIGNLTGSGVLTSAVVNFHDVVGNVRNVVSNQAIQNGFHIANGPFSLTTITIDNDDAVAPQIINLAINGNAVIQTHDTSTFINSVFPLGLSNAEAYSGGNLLVNATGNLTVKGGTPIDHALSTDILGFGSAFIFPGGIALKAGGTLTVNAPIDNGYTAVAGPNFQGIFLAAPTIIVNAPMVTSGNTFVHTSVSVPVAVYSAANSLLFPSYYNANLTPGKLVVSPFPF
ncbi:beta strand repeat-containing protein [Candidatus Methylacidiphilum infernorum]|uniref:Large exoprotein involved in heme utilization or adhesion n=1 Tax=Methylacidiphilum infernorum (isolate V4) TaxID=481448 RepID=B3DZ36_METI4|nr:hypothetical protein [Candidatus Methylacidiphilum infernorum]ACD84128.1 Large exoprotein involved in heme utilization or adhesion [Methylacidiphilum infernorum V4]